VEAIDSMLASGQLVPGQRLVEAALTGQLKTSRSVVREALRYLAGEGVVEIIPNRGARIRTIEPSQLGDMLDVFAALLRAAMERLIAKGITEADKVSIAACLEQIRTSLKQESRYHVIRAAYDYHMQICKLSGNAYFTDVLNRLHIHHYNRQDIIQNYAPHNSPYVMYSAMTAKLFAGDADGAYQVWRREIENVAAHLESQGREHRVKPRPPARSAIG
jgi:DNA-binding GntR family transcriptional regulator